MVVCRIVALFFLLFCDVSKGGNGLKDSDAGLVLGITQTHNKNKTLSSAWASVVYTEERQTRKQARRAKLRLRNKQGRVRGQTKQMRATISLPLSRCQA